jgi:Abortive infection alpha
MFGLTRVVKDLMVLTDRPDRPATSPDMTAGLRTLARVAFAPLAAFPRRASELPELLRTLGERGLAIPASRRRAPNPTLALKALAGFVRSEGEVRDGYLSLLTATMDKAVADEVHPSFLDLLAQLSGDELRLLASFESEGPFPLITLSSRLRHGGGSRVELRHFSLLGERAGCADPSRTPAYLDNLARLGLVEVRPTRMTDDVRMFQELEEHPIVVAARTHIEEQAPVRIGPISEPIVADLQYRSLIVTAFGRQFRGACFFRPDGDFARPRSSDLSREVSRATHQAAPM